MLRFVGLVAMLIGIGVLSSNVVINEVLYDAIGSDEGNEWIELFNNGEEDVSLRGWEIQSAGTEFITNFTFPQIWIRAQSYLLISEDTFSDANLITTLDLQNSGNTVDGIRLISPYQQYTDTILYGLQNDNQLAGDIENQQPCLNVQTGHTLARVVDGVDNNSSSDWFDSSNPTPGTSNIQVANITIEDVEIVNIDNSIEVSTIIRNLSTWIVHNVYISVKILLNNQLIYEESISEIMGDSSVTISYTVSNDLTFDGKLEVLLYSTDNINIVDNMWIEWITPNIIEAKLSELLYKPNSGDSEWIELKLMQNVTSKEVILRDSSARMCSAIISGSAGDYVVVTEEKSNMISQYPDIDETKVFEASGWIQLNNTGDTVSLFAGTTLLDSILYNYNSILAGHSIEKNFNTLSWEENNSLTGATPTTEFIASENTDSSNDVKLYRIISKRISKKLNKEFEIELSSSVDLNKIELLVYDIRGRKLGKVEESIGDISSFTWNGRLNNKNLKSGVYPCKLRIMKTNNKFLIDKQLIISINE